MPTQTEYADSFKARGLTDQQAADLADRFAARDTAQLDREATVAAAKAVRELERARLRALRHTPGKKPKGRPFWNDTLKRWERK